VNVRRVRLIVGALVVGFVLALGLGSAGLFGGGRALGADTTLTIISGDVSVRHGAGANFISGVDGEVLKAGDAIKTADDARAVLTYFEGSTVTIEPGTVLSIDEARAAQGSRTIRMTQDVGRTWHVVSKLLSGNSKYEVRTPASTASVRGTSFEVANQGPITTLSTSEGTVVSQVADPVQPGKTVEVEVPAGNQQTQEVNAPPAPTKQAPPPERKVTVIVEATNSVVVDPLGRSNGVTKDGKIVIQTPGAKVRVENGTVVIEMPDLPDGKIATRVDKEKETTATSSDDVKVTTTIAEKGKSDVVVADVAKRDQDKKATTGIEIKKDDSGSTKSRTLAGDEVKVLPSTKGADITGSLTGNRDNGKTAEPQSTDKAKETTGTGTNTSPGTQNNDQSVPKKDTTDQKVDTGPKKDAPGQTVDTSGEKKSTPDLPANIPDRKSPSGQTGDANGQNSSDPKKDDPRAPASPPTGFIPQIQLPNPLDQQQRDQQLKEQQQKAEQQLREQQQREQQQKDAEKAAAEKAAAEKAAAQRAAAEKAAAERAAAEKAAAEKAAADRAAAEKAAADRAAAERAAELLKEQQKAAEELRHKKSPPPEPSPTPAKQVLPGNPGQGQNRP